VINLLFILLLVPNKIDLKEIRQLFMVVDKKEQACEELLSFTDGYTIGYKPLIYAYHAAAEMTMANHVSWPGSKLKYFKAGRIKLEAVVKENMDNVEIRYIRFAVQYGSPGFLGYQDDMEQDKAFIKKNLEKAELPPYLKKIIKATIEQ